MSLWTNMSLQDGNSFVMENLIFFHDYVMVVIILILSLIMYMLFFMILNKFINRFMFEGQLIEIIWTLIPVLLLLLLVFPSLKILYMMDDNTMSFFTVKILGHQWYWSYEYSDFFEINYDSYMLKDLSDLNNSLFRLLDVDNRMIIPMGCFIRLVIGSMDVIHSFTVPSGGFKVDAVPGRTNQVIIMVNRFGLLYGQCSEICGVNHSFMPIVVEVVDICSFMKWINNF